MSTRIQFPLECAIPLDSLTEVEFSMLKAASMLEPRVNAASVYFDGTLWVTGGQSNTGILDTTEYYVFTEDRWIKG